ncbi:MAG TPA: hypothetical protein PKJ45_08405 [Rubrivivax sp.]|nr:hypothetical protein [Rubrivivax sp.]
MTEYTVTRWKRSRHWAVMRGDALTTLCVYRRGARALVALLQSLEATP